MKEIRVKKCSKCKTEKLLDCFWEQKDNLFNKRSMCKSCYRKYSEKYYEIYSKNSPWLKHFRRAKNRISSRSSYKGRVFTVTLKELKEIWFRDKAYLLKYPSIDRINNNIGYTKENCQFIEFIANCKKGVS